MNNYDKRMKQAQDDFDKEWASFKRMAIIAITLKIAIFLGSISFIVWVIIKLMQYFGAI